MEVEQLVSMTNLAQINLVLLDQSIIINLMKAYLKGENLLNREHIENYQKLMKFKSLQLKMNKV